MKLFVVLSRVPYPLDKGDKLRAWHQLKTLKNDYEIFLFCLDDSGKGEQHKDKLQEIANHVVIYPVSRWRIAFRILPALFSSKPFQVWYFSPSGASKQVKKLLLEFNPDHILAQMIRTCELVKNYHNFPKTLDYMDALSKGAERRIKKERGIKKFFWTIEWRRLLAYENLMFNYFDNKVIISKQDRNLIYHPERKNIHIIPNGVDTQFYKPVEKEKEFDVVFVGNLSYLPNVHAAQVLAREVMPLLQQNNESIKLLLSGASPLAEVLSLQNKNITVTGWVEDIRNSYASGKIFVAPMHIGTGMQNKLLEAMAMGIPVVTTPLASEAIGGEHGNHLMVAENPVDIARAINALLSDGGLYRSLSKNGREYVCENYAWEKQTASLKKIICSTNEA